MSITPRLTTVALPAVVKMRFAAFLILLQLRVSSSQFCVSSTIAGSGAAAYSDLVGTNAAFNSPGRTVVDPTWTPARESVGLSYYALIADRGNNNIRRLFSNGTVDTLFGDNAQYVGPQTLAGWVAGPISRDGAGLNASFNGPYDIAANASSGAFFVVEGIGARVRLISSAGVVSTVAGGGSCGIYCVGGFPGPYGFGIQDGGGTSVQFSVLRGVAVSFDGKYAFICDMYSNRIRAMDTNTFLVTTYAGNSAGSPLAGGNADGSALSASFYYPMGIAAARDGTVFVADAFNSRIRYITPAGNVGGVVGTLAGNSQGYRDGVGVNALFATAWGVSIDADGSVLVADSSNHRLRRIANDEFATVSTFLGTGAVSSVDGNGTSSATLNTPRGIVAHPDGSYLVTETTGGKIRRVVCPSPSASPTPTPTSSSGSTASTTPSFSRSGTSSVTPTATPSSSGVGCSVRTVAAVSLSTSVRIATDFSGTSFLLADATLKTVSSVTASGVITLLAGTPGTTGTTTDVPALSATFTGPSSAVPGGDANTIFILDAAHVIHVLTVGGNVNRLAGSGVPSFAEGTGSSALFNNPVAGLWWPPTSSVLVVDANNFRLRAITVGGVTSTLCGSGAAVSLDGVGTAAAFAAPRAIATVAATELVYIIDASCVRSFAPATGVLVTLAGRSAAAGFANGLPLDARFSNPLSLTAYQGALVVADTPNFVLRAVATSGMTNAFAGSGNTPLLPLTV